MTLETQSSYEIRNYTEGVLEAQFEIGRKEQDKRVGWNMTNIENLKKAYSGENFDPSIKYYAYRGDELVGYCTATQQPPTEEGEVVAKMEFPIALEEHSQSKKILLEHAFKDLKSKGIKKVQSRVSKDWPGTLDFSEKYNYEFQSNLTKRGVLETSKLESKPIATEIKTIDLDNSELLERIVKYYVEKLKAPEKSIRSQFDFIKNNPEAIIGLNYYEKNGEILSITALSYLPGEKNAAGFASISAFGEDPETVKEAMFNNQIVLAKKRGIQNLVVVLFGPELSSEAKFSEIGFEFNHTLSMYEKVL